MLMMSRQRMDPEPRPEPAQPDIVGDRSRGAPASPTARKTAGVQRNIFTTL